MKIYTRTGDNGTTFCMAKNGRVKKYDPLLEFIGTLDEANSSLGLAVGLCKDLGDNVCNSDIISIIKLFQKIIFNIGFFIAGKNNFEGNEVTYLEELIDKNMNKINLTGFIYPGGCSVCGALHLARAILRRAERQYWKLLDEGHFSGVLSSEDSLFVGRLLNRLSDALFAIALKISFLNDSIEYI